MTHNEIHEALCENTIRFERVIYLAGATAYASSLAQDLRHFLDDEDDKTVIQAFPGFPASLRDDEDDALELSAEWLINEQRLGFLVQVATPVMLHSKASTGCSFSWGRYTVEWVYGETMDEVVAKAIAWADKRRRAEKAKAK